MTLWQERSARYTGLQIGGVAVLVTFRRDEV